MILTSPARSLLLAAALVGLAVRPLPRQQAAFSSTVEVVRVDALVSDGTRAIKGLKPADFLVSDNGVPQEVDFVQFEQAPLNVLLLLDASDSVVGERLEHLRAAGDAALGALRPEDHVALLTFSDAVSLAAGPTHSFDAVRAAIRQIRPGGGTALYDAVHAGIVLGESSESRGVVLVFTDGTDTVSFLTKGAVLDSARRGSAVVYAALEGRRTSFLNDVTKLTGGSVTRVSSTKDLPGLFLRILDEFRQRYLIGYSPKGVARTGWHRLEVSVKGRCCEVRARTGYQVGR